MHARLFTIVTALTLAIGIGANSAIFSVLEGILLKPLPFPHPESLVALNHTAPGINFIDAGIAPFLYFTYREEGRSFQNVAIWQPDSGSVTGLAEPQEVRVINVTAEFLPVLAVQPLLGRWFTAADTAPNAPLTTLLTYGYWQTHFGGDRSVLGRNLILDGKPREIVGVVPAEVGRYFDPKLAVVLPLHLDRAKTFIGNFSYRGIARLKPGVTLIQASADMIRMIPIAIRSFPAPPGFSASMFEQARLTPRLHSYRDEVVGDIGSTLWILMGTIGVVLLIACANVANLMLVRADGRQHELAIRAALGAGWGRIARELLAESIAIGLLGGAAGLALAYGAIQLLIQIAPANLPRLTDISIDPWVVLFTLAVSLLAGLIFGLIPVIKYVGPRGVLASTLRSGGRGLSESKERHRMRGALVVIQVALALLLLIGSGLMIRTFQALRHVDPGFTRPDQLQTLRIYVPEAEVRDPTATVRMEQAILDKIATIPGVSSAGLSSVLPMDRDGWMDPVFPEQSADSGSVPPLRRYKFVSPGLLRTMGNRLVAGRDFTWDDTYQRRPVAMVSENLARELWHDPALAIGKRVREALKGPLREIVGVVSDEREDGVNHPAPTMAYWPVIMDDFEGDHVSLRRSLNYVVRSDRAGSQGLLKAIEQAVWSLDPNLPLADVTTLQALYEKSLARTSFTLVLLAIAGAMAMLIGLVGIYGVISYSVTQRTREIGIRMALGAEQRTLAGMFVGHGFLLAGIGVACGLAAAAVLTRLMSSLLFEVKAVDPLTYAAVALAVIAAALLASYLPALRATKVDPVVALRSE
jgi:predicted permease